ncbi:hypothetical protein D3C71_563870 [compost metagenome]
MSYMSEKKAQELFKQQMQAELTNDDLARELERQLNDAGWFITSGPDGTTIKRKDGSLTDSAIDLFYMPKESPVAPNPSTDNPNSKMWRNIGIGVLIVIATVLIIWSSVKLYRHFKTKGNATG